MKITFLGTAAAEGIPGLFCRCSICQHAWVNGGKDVRARASVLVDDIFKIDFGPDSYQQSLRAQQPLHQVKHLLITHTHSDHFYPEDLHMHKQPFIAASSPGHLLNIYGCPAVGEILEEEAKTDDSVVFHPLTAFEPHNIEDATVVPLPAEHSSRGQPFIYLFQRNGITLLHGYDTGYFFEEVWSYLEGKTIDVALLDCTAGKFPSRGHMGIPNILEVKKRMLESGIATEKTVFVATHFSHNGQLLHHQLEERLHPEGFLVAYDGMVLEIEA
ncbi:MAG TPA: carbon-phosphorus lyase [Firmicutes bacterium]|nr:carbon-phosphorus lyase [Bacillota bacterium]